jgi:hypothetical protein
MFKQYRRTRREVPLLPAQRTIKVELLLAEPKLPFGVPCRKLSGAIGIRGYSPSWEGLGVGLARRTGKSGTSKIEKC